MGEINRLLSEGKDDFHQEKNELLKTGLAVSAYITVDESGARHKGKNGYVTQIGNAHLDTLQITTARHRRVATEGALLGNVQDSGRCQDLVIVSDDAGQFNILQHALCWIHTERLIHILIPLNEGHRENIARGRGDIWEFYRAQKDSKEQPSENQQSALEALLRNNDIQTILK